MTPGLLAFSWLVCWYFFFVRYAPTVSAPSRFDRGFALSSYCVVVALFFWTALMWMRPPQTISVSVLALAVLLVGAGQFLMCAARMRLPLSNRDLFMRISVSLSSGGVYRSLSHPMYLGLFLALVGSSLALGNSPALAAAVLVGLLLGLRAILESRS